MKHEYTSKRVASIAGRILKGGKFSVEEIHALAASALTQTKHKRKTRKPVR